MPQMKMIYYFYINLKHLFPFYWSYVTEYNNIRKLTNKQKLQKRFMQTLNKSCSLREIHYNIAWCSSKYTLPLASSNLLLSESVYPWQNAAPHILQQHMFTFQFSSAQKKPFFLFYFKALPDDFIEPSLILISMLFMVLKTSLKYGITLASFKVRSHSPLHMICLHSCFPWHRHDHSQMLSSDTYIVSCTMFCFAV